MAKPDKEEQKPKRASLVRKFAARYFIEPDKLMATLKATAFKQRAGGEVTDEQMAALLVVADQYGLNPFTREIYAYPDKNLGIVPVVGLDGWSRIINEHPQCDGFDFKESETTVKLAGTEREAPEWMEVTFHRKDRSHPTIVREYMEEVYRPPFKGTKNGHAYIIDGPWQTHGRRMLRHKTLIQGARIALGFAGIYDEDEAQRIMERDITPEVEVEKSRPQRGPAGLKQALLPENAEAGGQPPPTQAVPKEKELVQRNGNAAESASEDSPQDRRTPSVDPAAAEPPSQKSLIAEALQRLEEATNEDQYFFALDLVREVPEAERLELDDAAAQAAKRLGLREPE